MKKASLFLAVSLLAACAREQVPRLPAEEVMRRAVETSAALESASYELAGTFAFAGADGMNVAGDARIKGSIDAGGRQVTLSPVITARLGGGSKPVALRLALDVFLAGANEVYVKLHELDSDPSGVFVTGERWTGLKDRWLAVGSKDSSTGGELPLDPEILRAQLESAVVERDRGGERVAGRLAYHYDIRLDPAKLGAFLAETSADAPGIGELAALNARGTIWIDAEHFRVLALRWDIDALPLAGGTLRTAFRLELADHNAVQPLSPPSDAETMTVRPPEDPSRQNDPLQELESLLLGTGKTR